MMTFGLLSFAQYSVTRDEPADRLSITLTLVLTAASYKFATTSMTPAISYITLLDRYVFFNSLMIVSNAIEGDWSTPHSLTFSPPSSPFLTLSPLRSPSRTFTNLRSPPIILSGAIVTETRFPAP